MAVVRGVLVCLLLAQVFWPIMYVSSSIEAMKDPSSAMVVLFAIVIPFFVFMLAKFLPVDFEDAKGVSRKRNFIYYSCCFFSIMSNFSLIAVFEEFHLIEHYVGFYFEKNEPYLASAYGTAVHFCDAIVSIALYLTIIYKYDNGQNYFGLSLYWSGGMMQGMTCHLTGALIGSYGDRVTGASLFSVLYIVVAIFALKHILELQSDQASSGHELRMSAVSEPIDFLLFVGLLLSIAFGFLRGLAALGSPLPLVQYYLREFEPYIMEPGKFGAVHCIFCLLYLVPIYAICAYYLVTGNIGQTAENLSILMTGATTNGCSVYLLASFLSETHRVTKNVEMVVILNLLPVVTSFSMMLKLLRIRGLYIGSSLKKNRMRGM